MKIKELFTDESKFTKLAFARDKDGKHETTISENAVCWCILGAIDRCYTEKPHPIIKKVRRAIGQESVMDWNDAPERTFADVKALVEKLDI